MRKIYILASSPSDLTEMVDLADTLAQRGNRVTLAYFNEGGFSTFDAKINARIQAIQDSAAMTTAYILEPGGSLFDSTLSIISRLRALLKKDNTPQIRKLEGDPSLWMRLMLLRQRILNGHPFLRKCKCAALIQIRRMERVKQRYFGKRRIKKAIGALTAKCAPTVNKILVNVYLVSVYHRNLKTFRAELREKQFDAILIPEDIVGSVWPLMIKAAHEIGIPTLVFPYTLANQKEAVQSLKNEPAFQCGNNRLSAKLFPRWRWHADGADLVRLPSGHIFAHQLFGVAPPDPWLMNSGYANAICVDSQASLEYFANSGIPQTKLFVTGSVSQDHLYAQKAIKAQALAELVESLGLVGNKPLLLISGCPNQLAGKVPYCEFKTIEEVADHVGQALAPLRDVYHIVVRPHPNYLQFAELMRPYGVVSTLVPTSRLVPLADLFIGFASATIRWAIACAVPTVNYDIFHYCYNDFGNAHGVITLTDSGAFTSILAALPPGSEMHRGLKAKIENDSKFWSYLDGGSVDRIQAAIDFECGKSRAVRRSS